MARASGAFELTEMQWIKIHVRLAALEQSGPRLQYRFEFGADLNADVNCNIYFTDDESHPLSESSPAERLEIQEGWIAVGSDILRHALELAELPPTFRWQPAVKYVLLQGYGMGGAVLRTVRRSFTWPQRESNPD